MKTTYSDNFIRFWKVYPSRMGLKTGKSQSYKIWVRDKLDSDTDAIIASVEAHKSLKQWLEDEGKYIPMPTTFLNQERYEDEIEVKVKRELIL